MATWRRRNLVGRRQRLGAPAGARIWARCCEIKNVNSYRYIQQAIAYESRRQASRSSGEDAKGKILQETRLRSSTRGETRSMRSKEQAHDYRYFPDPDLLLLIIDPAPGGGNQGHPAGAAGRQAGQGWRASMASRIYEDAGVLATDTARADYFEQAAAGRDAKLTANTVTNAVLPRTSPRTAWRSRTARCPPPTWPSWCVCRRRG